MLLHSVTFKSSDAFVTKPDITIPLKVRYRTKEASCFALNVRVTALGHVESSSRARGCNYAQRMQDISLHETHFMKEGREASRVRRDLFICWSCMTRATVPELNFVYISCAGRGR